MNFINKINGFSDMSYEEAHDILNLYSFLWDDDGQPLGFGHDCRLSIDEIGDLQDSLYDHDNFFVCEGDDGLIYGVEYTYKFGDPVPGVWQRIKEVVKL